MDPISITLIVVSGSIVITAAGRFISKKYHSYQSSSNDNEVEVTTEEISADGASKKTTIKFHGKNHGVNILDENHKERGDAEAVKALASLGALLPGLSNIPGKVSNSMDNASAPDHEASKTNIISEVKKVFVPLSKKVADTFIKHNNSSDTEEITQDTSSASVETDDRARNESPTCIAHFIDSSRSSIRHLNSSDSEGFFDPVGNEDDAHSFNNTSVSGASSLDSCYSNDL